MNQRRFSALIVLFTLILTSAQVLAARNDHPLAVQNRISKKLPKTTVLRFNEATGRISVFVTKKELSPTDSTELYLKSNESQFQSIDPAETMVTQTRRGSDEWYFYFYNENPFYPAFYMNGHVYRLSYYYSFYWYGHTYRLYRWNMN